MLVSLGTEVVPLLGYSPTASGCTQLAHEFTTGIIGELRWRELYYSLEFSVVTGEPELLAPWIVGQWSLFQGASGQEYVFAANGGYQFWGGLTQEHEISDTEIELVTSTFEGDGAYAVNGDVVTLLPDGAEAESMLFRLFDRHAVSASGRVSQDRILGLMKSDIAGPFEVPLERSP